MVAVLAGGIPIAFAGFRSGLSDPFLDRYNLPLMVGACLVLAILLERVPRSALQKTVGVFVLCFAAASFQFRVANAYANDWTEQRQFLWQLAWRLPDLRDGTCLWSKISHDVP